MQNNYILLAPGTDEGFISLVCRQRRWMRACDDGVRISINSGTPTYVCVDNM